MSGEPGTSAVILGDSFDCGHNAWFLNSVLEYSGGAMVIVDGLRRAGELTP